MNAALPWFSLTHPVVVADSKSANVPFDKAEIEEMLRVGAYNVFQKGQFDQYSRIPHPLPDSGAWF